MPPPYRAVFFDAAHTLLEPARPVGEVYGDEAGALGVDLEGAALKASLARAWRDLWKVPEDPAQLATSEAAETERWWKLTRQVAEDFPALLRIHEPWLDRLVERFAAPESWRVLPGVLDLLARLSRKGLTLGVISNWQGALHPILRSLGIRDLVDFVLVSSEAGWRKPHPRIFEMALAHAGASASEALHVGDSPEEDVHGARACGLDTALVSGSRRGTPTTDATILLSSTSELDRSW